MENTNLKVISKSALLNNLSRFASKKICLMVKANAYGHGVAEIVRASDDVVYAYGVATEREAVELRKLTRRKVIVFGKVKNFHNCVKDNIEFMVDELEDLWLAIKSGAKHLMHLAINVGMNRYGFKDNFDKILQIVDKNEVKFCSIYTHFPNTSDKKQTEYEYKKFVEISTNFLSAPKCLGGSEVYAYNFDYDILRLGICAYGYGDGVKPIMRIESKIVKILKLKRGEFIGYGREYMAKEDGLFGVVPIGYFDGLRRGLSSNFEVTIGEKKYHSVGNICMDCFFVKIDKAVKLFDKVVVMDDADYFAKKLGTISYEVLTGFNSLRANTIIE